MLLPALAWADEFTYNGITYLVMDSQLKTVQVQKINNTGAIVIPANVNGYTVKRIGMCGNSGITSITIPSTVDRFVEDAFSGCTGLTEVKINDLNGLVQYSHDYGRGDRFLFKQSLALCT